MQEPFKLIVREEFLKFSLYMFSKILTDQNSLNHLRRGSFVPNYLSQCMRFPTIWFVRPAKPQISLRKRAV